MTAQRWIRVMVVPALMLGVAAFLLWMGLGILTHPSQGAAWLGWFLIAAAALKGSLWTFVTVTFLRRPGAVMAAHHWN